MSSAVEGSQSVSGRTQDIGEMVAPRVGARMAIVRGARSGQYDEVRSV